MVQPKHGTEFFDIGTIFQTVQDWVLMVGILVDFGLETAGNEWVFLVNCFRNSFRAEFQDCLLAEFIVVNDSLES